MTGTVGYPAPRDDEGAPVAGFLVIGIVGLAIVLLSLILGDILSGVFDALDLDVGGGIFSAPVVGSFLAAFGFGAALSMTAAGLGATEGAFAGLGGGVVVGGIALLLTRSLMDMPTGATQRADDLVGVRGTVVTDIPAEGLGEIQASVHGTTQKLSARADAAVPAGRVVEVVAMVSSTSAVVRPIDPDAEEGQDRAADDGPQ